MKNLFPRLTFAILIVLVALTLKAQTPTEWHDDLVERMTGSWKVQGQVMGRDAHHELKADWVLNHMFLRIHESTSTDAPASEKRYEAIWFLGYDPVIEKYVLHLFDVFERGFQRRWAVARATAIPCISRLNIRMGPFTPRFAGRPKVVAGNS